MFILRQQPFSYLGGGWDFHCARKLSKYFFLMRRKANIFFRIMWDRNTFVHKNNTLSTQIQQRKIFFLAGDSIHFFPATMQNLIFFRSARALKYFFFK